MIVGDIPPKHPNVGQDLKRFGSNDLTLGCFICQYRYMRILITAASKHGSTTEIAQALAKRLESYGHELTLTAPGDVPSVADFDAVVLGSAVYITQWMPVAHDFVKRFGEELRERPFWAFSVGMSGVPKHQPQDPMRIGPVMEHVDAVDHKTFPGRYKPELLTLRERSIGRLAGAIEGDFRDWEAVDAWADSINDYLAQQ